MKKSVVRVYMKWNESRETMLNVLVGTRGVQSGEAANLMLVHTVYGPGQLVFIA